MKVIGILGGHVSVSFDGWRVKAGYNLNKKGEIRVQLGYKGGNSEYKGGKSGYKWNTKTGNQDTTLKKRT